jgi:SH3-like domain-containing protein
MFRSSLSLTVLAGFFLLLLGCAESQQSLGEAYVAPASLNVRSQLSQKSNSVVMLKHGDAVAITDVLRRMVKVRTAAGFEGWVDSRELLSRDQMQQLRHERQQQARLPSEGTATAFEMLNIHIAPSRGAAAFTQIPEGGSVTILGRQIAPKIAAPVKSSLLYPEKPAPSRRSRKESSARQSFRLPPKPKPPKPPENWQELSSERIDGGQPAERHKTAPPPIPEQKSKPVVMEDWTLVRTATGDTGWVLSRNLMMSIPDEVAQYAEGKHITAFFDLGQVNDAQKGVKHHWLWTTLSGALPYDFDSWRVFLWNGRRHRYETSYRQRDLEGYFPVHVDPAEAGKTRTFQLVTKDSDGKLRKRGYSFDGTLVRLTGTQEYSQTAARSAASVLNATTPQPKIPHPNWLRRQWTNWRHRILGGADSMKTK